MSPSDTALAGWATAEFTPPTPCWMGGYAARTLPAESTHDGLFAHAFALGGPSAPLVLIVCDVIWVRASLVAAVRERIHESIPDATVWVSATHTHSGPDTGGQVLASPHARDEALEARIITACAQAATAAVRHMRQVRFAWATGEITGVATNRDHPDASAEVELDLLCCYTADTSSGPDVPVYPTAIFGSFPCHPTVLGAENRALTADLPGAFRRHLRALYGPDTWVSIATGAAADISTRHIRRQQSFDELDRLAEVFVRQALVLIDAAKPLSVTHPRPQSALVELDRKELPPRATLERQECVLQSRLVVERAAGHLSEARTLETTLQGLHGMARLADVLPNLDLRVEIVAAEAGRFRLVGIPGELYNRLGTEIRHASTYPTLLLGYTNGYIGYLPTREAYEQMDYEVLMSPHAPGSGEHVRDVACALLGSRKAVRF